MFLWNERGATADTGVGIMSGSCVDTDESVDDCCWGLRRPAPFPAAAMLRSASMLDAIVRSVDMDPRDVSLVCDDAVGEPGY